jgi:hypothetical protein
MIAIQQHPRPAIDPDWRELIGAFAIAGECGFIIARPRPHRVLLNDFDHRKVVDLLSCGSSALGRSL